MSKLVIQLSFFVTYLVVWLKAVPSAALGG